MNSLPKPVLIIGGVILAIIVIVVIVNLIKGSSGNQTVTPSTGTGSGSATGATGADLLTTEQNITAAITAGQTANATDITNLQTAITAAIASGNTSTLTTLETDLQNMQTAITANQTAANTANAAQITSLQTFLQQQLAALSAQINPAINASELLAPGNWHSAFGTLLAGNPQIAASETYNSSTNTFSITNTAVNQDAWIQSLLTYMPGLKNVPYDQLANAYQYMFIQNPNTYLNVPGTKDYTQANANQISYLQNLLAQWQSAGYVNVTGLPSTSMSTNA